MQRLKIISVVFLSVVALSLLILEQHLETGEVQDKKQYEKSQVLHAAQNLRTNLVTELIQAVNILFGLRAIIESEPTISQEKFEKYAASIKRTNRSIRSIAAAPNLVVRFVYPLKGNEASLGLDYRTAPMAQRAAAFRTMREGRSIIAGPVRLVQGGEAFIVRIPVYLTGEGGSLQEWGLLAAPIDVDILYKEIGLPAIAETLDVAIRGRDGLGSDGDVFYGNEALFSAKADSVLLDMELENGAWQIAVKPKNGWDANSLNHVFLRVSFMVTFAVFGLTWIAAIGYFSERIQARNRQLIAFREKSEFLEILSHEIRSPLQGVLGAQKFLLENGINSPMRSVVEEAHQAGEYIYGLINDYLDLQRAESEGLSIYLTPTNIRETIEKSFKIATVGKKSSSLAVNFYIDENVPELLYLDHAKMIQILVNIIGNALKYTSRGFVSVGGSYMENGAPPILTLKVEDSGIGIDRKELANLFDRFTRSENGERKTGSGLGLAIVKSLVEAMGGVIELDSELGKGTTFVVKIPAEIPSANDMQREKLKISASEEHLAGEKRKELLKDARILVADDVVVNRILINAMLAPMVGNVTMVEDGLQVLEELKSNEYDIVMMDVHMPNMNGIDATKRIRNRRKYRAIPIIGLTGDEAPENHKRLFAVGMDAVLVKPINLEPLLQRIEAVYLSHKEEKRKLTT